ncbi:MAG: sulfate reduction electron transfer complex DsrMKJOP subunit DsrM [Firmicutes bacterium]|nr:sulfate reduction electron transfer complex DsrMKJOP subunit DsrM [Bacillota bacterium]
MGALSSFVVVVLLILLAYIGVEAAGLQSFFGIAIPYAAVLTFIVGFIYRVITWGKSPVPFAITTTGGQQKSLPWIKQAKLDNPSSTAGVIGRMVLEILLFRSLFRNTQSELRDGKLGYGSAKWLWLAAIAFHWSFWIVLLRHIRFFATPAPAYLGLLESLDGFLQIGTPRLFLTGVILLVAVTYLLLRRFYIPKVRYISLASDYFPLFLIMAIASTGILMRYFFRVDITGVKELTMGLVTFNPVIPDGVSAIFYIHIFLVSSLFAYFPFSKLVHMGGVFLSPTRNLANNSRAVRHINPWNYPVKVHTYEEYEEEFREKMENAGIPVERPSAALIED